LKLDTGKVSGDMNNNMIAGNMIAFILPFLLSGGTSATAQG
jgi:hypothetical protein